MRISAVRKFLVYTLVSLAGMYISHYIPRKYFPVWVVVSLLIGHIINLKNYRKP